MYQKSTKKYSTKEAFFSIQGEGIRAGRAAVFCRFSGCNLWSGREVDRKSAICKICDTDFVGCDGENGGEFDSAENLAKSLKNLWPDVKSGKPYLVFTGGEPMLQLDDDLLQECKKIGFEIAIETNGTKKLIENIDWVTVSPKPDTKLIVEQGDELKLLYPLWKDPSRFENLDFTHFILQPLDDDNLDKHTKCALKYCLENPKWRLGLQLHKVVGVK